MDQQRDTSHVLAMYKELLQEYKEKSLAAEEATQLMESKFKQSEKRFIELEKELAIEKIRTKQLEERILHCDGIAKTINSLLKQSEDKVKDGEERMKRTESKLKTTEACLKETINLLKDTETKLKESESRNAAIKAEESAKDNARKETEDKIKSSSVRMEGTELYIVKLEGQLREAEDKLFTSELNLKRALDRLAEHDARVEAIEHDANKRLKGYEDGVKEAQRLLREREVVITQLMDSLSAAQNEVDRLGAMEKEYEKLQLDMRDANIRLETFRKVHWSVGGNLEQHLVDLAKQLKNSQEETAQLRAHILEYEHTDWLNSRLSRTSELSSLESHDDSKRFESPLFFGDVENREAIQQSVVYKQLEKELIKLQSHLEQERAWRLEAEEIAFSRTE